MRGIVIIRSRCRGSYGGGANTHRHTRVAHADATDTGDMSASRMNASDVTAAAASSA